MAYTDSLGLVSRPLFNEAEDGSGTEHRAICDSDGNLKVVVDDGIQGTPFEASDEQDIDGSLGAYGIGDVVSADDCCTTLAIPFEFDVGRDEGGQVLIDKALLFNETENQAVQYDLLLFNATPTGDLRDNAANDNPLKADIDKYLGVIHFQYSIAKGATVATYAEANPGDGVSGLPKPVKCAAGTTKIYGVLVTNTAYTQTAGDAIKIVLSGEQY